MKISYKVPLVASGLIIISFLGFAWLQYGQIKASIYKSTESYIDDTVTLLSDNISDWLNTRLAVINAMEHIIAQDYTPEKISEVMSIPEFEQYFTVLFGGTEDDGSVISSINNTFKFSPDWQVRERGWYQTALANNQAALTAPYLSDSNNALMISAVAKIVSGGKLVASFGGDIYLDEIAQTLNKVTMDNMSYFFLIDAKGNIISHPNASFYQKNISTLFDDPVSVQAKLQETSSQGKEVLAAFYPVKNVVNTKWSIGVVVDKSLAFKSATKLGRNSIITAVIASIIASLILYLLMRVILIQPVARLTKVSDEISRGAIDMDVPGVERKDEVGLLANAVMRIQKSLKMAMSRLEKHRKNK